MQQAQQLQRRQLTCLMVCAAPAAISNQQICHPCSISHLTSPAGPSSLAGGLSYVWPSLPWQPSSYRLPLQAG
jgi:hypothetical protein